MFVWIENWNWGLVEYSAEAKRQSEAADVHDHYFHIVMLSFHFVHKTSTPRQLRWLSNFNENE